MNNDKSWLFVSLISIFSLVGCTGGSGVGNGGSTSVISGKVTGPGGVISFASKGKVSAFLGSSEAPIPGARVELFRTGTKGQAVGRPLATTTADDNGQYTLSIPSDVSLSEVSTIVVASDLTDDKKVFQSFVGGKNVDVGMGSNATQLSIRIALMTELQALISEFSPEEIEQLHRAAKSILLNSNVPNFSAAYNAIRLDSGYVDLLDDVTDTDLSGVDLSKAPPLVFHPKVFDGSSNATTEYKFKVGDQFSVKARALDPFNLPLEYRFKLKRNCTDVEVVQDWSASDTFVYNFQMSDVNNCAYIVIGGSNNDGVNRDGSNGNVEYEVEFTSAPSWRATSVTAQTPEARGEHTAVWTGTKMIVWGGYCGLNGVNSGERDGGIYDPATDTWTNMTATNALSGRLVHQAAWTGNRMPIWGGMNPSATVQFGDGALYDIQTDSWTTMPATNAPADRSWGHNFC